MVEVAHGWHFTGNDSPLPVPCTKTGLFNYGSYANIRHVTHSYAI